MAYTCDCACHPDNNPQMKQYVFQFGTIETKIGVEPVFCCWCHYSQESE